MTVTFPEVVPQRTEILVVVWPDRMEAPAGTPQLYEVAPGTDTMLYVLVEPWHGAVLPEIAPGGVGAAMIVT